MSWKRMFQRKSLENLLAEMAGEHRLHRVLGLGSLTAMGVGAIIGAGIFAITGRVAADDAGPAIMISFIVAGAACGFAAFCYSEFAAMVPVAGSAYTYTYATLGEFWAWMIGWDLVLEYAMGCSVVAAHWSHYLNEVLDISFGWKLPPQLMSDPFSKIVVNGQEVQPYLNLPAVLIMAAVTTVLVLGIRQSAMTNGILVIVKTAVVLFVIGLGFKYVNVENWTSIPVEQRKSSDVVDYLSRNPELQSQLPPNAVATMTTGEQLLKEQPDFAAKLNDEQRRKIGSLPNEAKKWGLLGVLGIKRWLTPIDEALRNSFMPYGFSGIMVGAALVFFAFVGFDSISTHSEEAINPKRDVPLAILLSLGICTLLYLLVSGVLTGMTPYPNIDPGAAVAAAFRHQAETDQSPLLRAAAWLIAFGALAGMTSVLLVMFLSQARIFLAMSRDGLLPRSIFGVVHPRFGTPHRSTILTGICICLVAGFFPIKKLEEMISIGTLMAFALVCASVLTLRITRPDLNRPFRCPGLYFVAPAGIAVNLAMMMFLPFDTWLRLIVWMAIGLVIYFLYGFRNSTLSRRLEHELRTQGASPTDAPLDA